jgi:hypothetical protein
MARGYQLELGIASKFTEVKMRAPNPRKRWQGPARRVFKLQSANNLMPRGLSR